MSVPENTTDTSTFQGLIRALEDFWSRRGCAILQPLDLEIGAGTFHPETFLRALGSQPWNAVYTQACRRPADGRYGENPNRLQRYYQLQVVLKPSPDDIQSAYLESLTHLGIDPLVHDIRFVEDNWESPTLGAWGLGWEVWLNGMEITQFTYFQQAGGLPCSPVSGEITYGLERLAMYLQQKDRVYDLLWSRAANGAPAIHYGDLFLDNEREMSRYNFEFACVEDLLEQFSASEKTCLELSEEGLALPAYEQVIKASHCFNLLDARQAISVTERQSYVLRVRAMAGKVAEVYSSSRSGAQ